MNTHVKNIIGFIIHVAQVLYGYSPNGLPNGQPEGDIRGHVGVAFGF